MRDTLSRRSVRVDDVVEPARSVRGVLAITIGEETEEVITLSLNGSQTETKLHQIDEGSVALRARLGECLRGGLDLALELGEPGSSVKGQGRSGLVAVARAPTAGREREGENSGDEDAGKSGGHERISVDRTDRGAPAAHTREHANTTGQTAMDGADIIGTVAGALAALCGIASAWTRTHVIRARNADGPALKRMRTWVEANVPTPRRVEIRTTRNNEAVTEYGLTPAYGTHWTWLDGRPAWVRYRASEQGSYGGEDRYEDLVIGIAFPRKATVERLHTELCAPRVKGQRDGVNIRVWMHERWQACTSKAERTLESVAMDRTERHAILEELRDFEASKGWHAERGVPYRRSYLLSGPPGTGKTSLAFALAATLGRALYIVNAGSLRGDEGLIAAFTSIKDRAMVLIEDIDTAQVARSGETEGQTHTKPRTTLSALLNVIDGVLCPPGLVLMMTTNHPERLDAALTRPGRVDRHVRLEALDAESAGALVALWTGQATEECPAGLTGAEIEHTLLALRRDGRLNAREANAALAARAAEQRQ